MRFQLDMIGASRGRHHHRGHKAGLRRFHDQVDSLAAGRTRRGRFNFPTHRVSDEDVADDFAALQFDVADLER